MPTFFIEWVLHGITVKALILVIFRILLQVLSRMLGQLSLLCHLLKSEDRAGFHVSFPEGMVSCMPVQGLGPLP